MLIPLCCTSLECKTILEALIVRYKEVPAGLLQFNYSKYFSHAQHNSLGYWWIHVPLDCDVMGRGHTAKSGYIAFAWFKEDRHCRISSIKSVNCCRLCEAIMGRFILKILSMAFAT